MVPFTFLFRDIPRLYQQWIDFRVRRNRRLGIVDRILLVHHAGNSAIGRELDDIAHHFGITATVAALVSASNVAVVGPLIDALDLEGDALAVARSALIAILPTVTLQQLDIDKWQQMAIYNQLRPQQDGGLLDPDLALSIIDLTDRSDDVQAIPHLERLLRAEAADAQFDPVTSAARQCLDNLESRKANEDATKRLVRPVNAPETDLLLRSPVEYTRESTKPLLTPAEPPTKAAFHSNSDLEPTKPNG